MEANLSIPLNALFFSHFCCGVPFALKLSALIARRNVCLHVAFSMSRKYRQNYFEVMEKSK